MLVVSKWLYDFTVETKGEKKQDQCELLYRALILG